MIILILLCISYVSDIVSSVSVEEFQKNIQLYATDLSFGLKTNSDFSSVLTNNCTLFFENLSSDTKTIFTQAVVLCNSVVDENFKCVTDVTFEDALSMRLSLIQQPKFSELIVNTIGFLKQISQLMLWRQKDLFFHQISYELFRTQALVYFGSSLGQRIAEIDQTAYKNDLIEKHQAKMIAIYAELYCLYGESQLPVPIDVFKRYCAYYGCAKYLNTYGSDDFIVNLSKNIKIVNSKSNLQGCIHQAKLLSLALMVMRGFWGGNEMVGFARDSDSNCGHYTTGCSYAKDPKYGAMNIERLLNMNQNFLEHEFDLEALYPKLLKTAVAQAPQQKHILIRIAYAVLTFMRMWWNWLRQRNSQHAINKPLININERIDMMQPQAMQHPAVNEQQKSCVQKQIEYVQGSPLKLCAIKNLYQDTEKQFSCDHSSWWFKYWHVKEAAIASILGLKIRLFSHDTTNPDSVVTELTPEEPCYPKTARDVCVWTDNTAYHDSLLLKPTQLVSIAHAIGYELQYWKIDVNNQDWLTKWCNKFSAYQRDWLERDKKRD